MRLWSVAELPSFCFLHSISLSLSFCIPSRGILFLLRAVWTATTLAWNYIIGTAKFTFVYIRHTIRNCERGYAFFSRTREWLNRNFPAKNAGFVLNSFRRSYISRLFSFFFLSIWEFWGCTIIFAKWVEMFLFYKISN